MIFRIKDIPCGSHFCLVYYFHVEQFENVQQYTENDLVEYHPYNFDENFQEILQSVE